MTEYLVARLFYISWKNRSDTEAAAECVSIWVAVLWLSLQLYLCIFIKIP